MTRSAAPHGIHPSGTTAARRRDLHTASVQSAHPSQATPHGEPPSAIVIGDRCIDHNTVGRQALASTWGSPTLFIARHLRLEHGLRPVVSGPYASDLLPFLDEFACDQGPSGQRSLSYRNVVEPTRRTSNERVADQQRVQYWRPADRPLQPIACQPPGGVSLWFLSSRCGRFCLVVGAVAEHGVEDVDASSGQADEGRVVLLSRGSFPVVVGA